MSGASPDRADDALVQATRRLREIAEEIRGAQNAPPERVAALADEAARLAGEVAAEIGRDLRGDVEP